MGILISKENILYSNFLDNLKTLRVCRNLGLKQNIYILEFTLQKQILPNIFVKFLVQISYTWGKKHDKLVTFHRYRSLF